MRVIPPTNNIRSRTVANNPPNLAKDLAKSSPPMFFKNPKVASPAFTPKSIKDINPLRNLPPISITKLTNLPRLTTIGINLGNNGINLIAINPSIHPLTNFLILSKKT